MANSTTHYPDRGFISASLLGTLCSVALMLIVVGYALSILHDYQDEQTYINTASYTTNIAQAAKRYVADHYNDLVTATSTTGVQISTADLINNGYLPTQFLGKNSFQQTYKTLVVRNPKIDSALDVLLVSDGGQAIPYKGLRSISMHITGMGGYVQNNVAIGTLSGWKRPLSEWNTTVRDGHLVMDLSSDTLETTNDESDRLYRFAVNSNPDLNRMHTAIDMNEQDINNGHNANLNGNLAANTGSFNGRLNANEYMYIGGTAIVNNPCSPDGLIGKDSKGALLNCVKGIWKSSTDLEIVNSISKGYQTCEHGTFNLGIYKMCAITGFSSYGANASCSLKFNKDGSWTGTTNYYCAHGDDWVSSTCSYSCIK